MMKMTVSKIREIIREVYYSGSYQSEAYDKALIDDLCFDEHSAYVQDDVKNAIKKWMRIMGLDGHMTDTRIHS